MRYLIKLLLLLLPVIGLTAYSKAQALSDIKNSFKKYEQQALQEKIYVHTDKTFYLAGEILWFKVYTVEATLNKPLDVSKVAYIDVLNNDNNPLLHVKIALKNGIGSGSVYIPLTAVNGNYTLRAYTNWMKNFSPDLYFQQPIAIVNSLVSPQQPKTETIADYDIRFFPEGGNLVTGIKSTVAFKAVAPDGKGIDVSGAIINQRNDTLARFVSLKFGMGHFSFTPVSSDTYRAVVRIGQNNTVIKGLPAISSQGYVMQLADNGAGQLAITVNSNLSGQKDEAVSVFIHSGQFIKAADTVKLINGSARLVIDKSKLGDGISHITLFNNSGQPVCERLCFKRPKQLVLSAGADHQTYNLRKKVNVDISAQNEAGKPLIADLSLAVYRLDSLETSNGAGISSYLWLASELRGNIESPDYYFKQNDPESTEALDNLLMTQGWSRFEWGNLLTSKMPVIDFLPEYSGHIITAKVTEKLSGKPVKNIKAYLGVAGKRVQLHGVQSDQYGRLLFSTKDLYGYNELVLQFASQKDSLLRLDILNPFSEQYSSNRSAPLKFSNSIKNALETHHVDMQAQNTFAANKIKKFYNPMVDSSAFYGKTKTYLLDEFTRFTTMEEVLREYVSEVNLVRQQKKLHIKIISGGYFLSDDDPLLILDGIPVLNTDKIIAIDPLKVRKLEVVPKTYYLGPTSAEGILSFTTYKGDLGGVDIDPHALVVDYEGLQLQREFYSPVYETQNQQKSRLPDFRNLLYWSPNAATNSTGKSKAEFYTSDEAGKYIGIIQGITADGEAGSQYFTFEVKESNN